MSLTAWDSPIWLGWLASTVPALGVQENASMPSFEWVQSTQLRSSCLCSENFDNRAVSPVLLQLRDTKSNLFVV